MLFRTHIRRALPMLKLHKDCVKPQGNGFPKSTPKERNIPPTFHVQSSPLHNFCACQRDRSANFQGNMTQKRAFSQESWEDLRQKHKGKTPAAKFGVIDLEEVVEFLREEGAVDIVVIKVPDEMCYVDYFIIVTALSARHLSSISQMTNKLYKQKRKSGQPFIVIEGKRNSEDWQCLDMGDMVLHIMLRETREHYNLEKLWLLGQEYDDLLHEAPSDDEIMKRLSMEGLNLMSMNEDMVKALGNLDVPNPWVTEPEDFYERGDLSWNEEPDLTGDSQTKKDNKLDDDDAFLV